MGATTEALVSLQCLPAPPAACRPEGLLWLPLAAAWHPDPMWPPDRTGCRPVLDESLCCGIDAEWPPEDTTQEAQRGSPPHATLVQLALWLPPGISCIPALDDADGWRVGAGGTSTSGRCCALLLDMLSLPPAETRQALQALFRCSAARCPWLAPVSLQPACQHCPCSSLCSLAGSCPCPSAALHRSVPPAAPCCCHVGTRAA